LHSEEKKEYVITKKRQPTEWAKIVSNDATRALTQKYTDNLYNSTAKKKKNELKKGRRPE